MSMLSICLLITKFGATQVSLPDTLAKIFERYDSLNYISFDVNYSYNSDTLFGKFVDEKLDGNMTLAGKKYRYTMGDIEFMQNENSFIAVYNYNKTIYITNPKTNNSAYLLPLRELMDSIVNAYSSSYNISFSFADTAGTITFDGIDSTAQFKKFIIKYNPTTKFLNSVRYEFEEPEIINPEDSIKPPELVLRKKSLTIKFFNYKIANFSDELYSDDYFVWPERGIYQPSDRFKGYRIFNQKSTYNQGY